MRSRRGSGLALVAAGVCLVASGATAVGWDSPAAQGAPAPVAAASTPVAVPPPPAPPLAAPAAPKPPARKPAAARPLPGAVADAEAAPPRRVVIPRIGVDSTLIGLRVQRDRTLEVPRDFDVAGWYREGTKPGDAGPAVLVGHVDSYDGPAVFFRLSELRRGDRIAVYRTDGSRVVFAVQAQERVPKNAFPTARVYGATAGPELRLLTCGGRFDPTTKHYEDNVVVYAKQVRA